MPVIVSSCVASLGRCRIERGPESVGLLLTPGRRSIFTEDSGPHVIFLTMGQFLQVELSPNVVR